MLNNIKNHSQVVANAAKKLYALLLSNGKCTDLPEERTVVAGALLHDIAKTQCLTENCDHAEVGATICMKHGYPAIAEIVAEHVLLAKHQPERYKKGIFLAKEIVYYADKRVLHEDVVNLSQRCDYIMKRYGGFSNKERHKIIRSNFRKCLELEEWLCHFAGVHADELFIPRPSNRIVQ